jgi:AGZA family xanthine/uracil permease-like MFS transporter
MPLTFSIATGIGLGFISYTAIKLLCGRRQDVGPAVLLIAGVFVIFFITK